MYLLIDVSIWLTLSLAFVNAFFLVRIFIIQHDCGHQSFTASRRFNNAVGYICSLLSFMPYHYWAKSHNYHHGHNGLLFEHRDIGDVNLLTVEEFGRLGRLQRWGYRLYRSPFVLFGVAPMWYILVQQRMPLVRLKGWEQVHLTQMKHNIALLALHLGIVWLLGYKAFVLVHLPIIAVFGVIAMWFFYVQHQHEITYKQWKERWEYVRAAVQGSTYYKLPKVFHWLTGNIGYHHIHHLNSLIPSYHLARCHRDHPIFEKLVTSITFWQSLRFVKNKLWDEDQQKMISFREYFRRHAATSK